MKPILEIAIRFHNITVFWLHKYSIDETPLKHYKYYWSQTFTVCVYIYIYTVMVSVISPLGKYEQIRL